MNSFVYVAIIFQDYIFLFKFSVFLFASFLSFAWVIYIGILFSFYFLFLGLQKKKKALKISEVCKFTLVSFVSEFILNLFVISLIFWDTVLTLIHTFILVIPKIYISTLKLCHRVLKFCLGLQDKEEIA